MTDGQNLFDDNSTPHGSWEVVKAVENEQKSGVGNAVIVGIDNGNAWRDSELTPKSIGEVQHLEMFCEDFKPEGEIFDNFCRKIFRPILSCVTEKCRRKHTCIAEFFRVFKSRKK